MGLFSWIGRLFGSKPAPQRGDVVQEMIASLSSTSWYYQRDGQRVGPYSLQRLQQLLQAGLLTLNDRVQHEGATTWVLLSSVLPAAEAMPAAPSAPPKPASAPPRPASPPKAAAPAPAPSSTADEWFCTRDGKARTGPFSLPQLQKMLQGGLIPPRIMVWREGMPQWQELSTVLAVLFPSQPPRTDVLHTPTGPVGTEAGYSPQATSWCLSVDRKYVYRGESLSSIQSKYRNRQIGAGAIVWRPGLPGWVPVTSLEGIATPAPSATPAAPAPTPAAAPVSLTAPPYDKIHQPAEMVGPEPGKAPATIGWHLTLDRKSAYRGESLASILTKLRTGEIDGSAFAWRPGLPGWVPVTLLQGAVATGTAPAPVEPRIDSPWDTTWYYQSNNVRIGPHSYTQLRQLVESGQLQLSDFVQPEGATAWVQVTFALPGVAPRPTVLPTPASPPQPAAQPGTLDLNAGDFLPIARDDLKEQAQSTARWGPWFGRRDVIPPADDPRTKLIDRGLVSNGLLTPEQLVEIHQIGAEMERIRPTLITIEHQAARSGTAAVEAERERRAQLKEQKKADAARRKQEHAEAVARRRATDIVFLGRGVSKWLDQRTSDAGKLESLGLPVLSTPAELATALGLSIPRLRWLAFHNEVAERVHYVQFTVTKKSGGLRTLSAPHKTLKAAQHWILQNIVNKLPAEGAAHGFLAGKSILTNAAPHVGQAVLLNLDLENFFPTVSFARVRSVFRRAGYSGAVATILALLCTECPRRTVQYDGKTYHVATGPRGLPQGACTSPGLSNQVARRLDRRLGGLARKLGLAYTRYADDLSLSGSLPLPVTPKEGTGAPADQPRKHGIGYVLARVRHIVEEEGFRINQKKSRILRQSTAQLVTGVVVNARPSLPRKELRRLRAILHRARREGLEAQNRAGHKHFRAWLEGKIAYVAMVRPELGAKMKSELGQLR
ncbi:MAG: GYF domain-containing protein [Gemmataceae bacterium]